MKMVLLISGKKRHGKNQAAIFFKEAFKKHNITAEQFAFADSVKDVVARDFRYFTYEHLYGDKKEVLIPEYKKTCREVMQFVGEFYRTVEPNYWVNILKEKLTRLMYKQQFDVAMITDCRYPNEMDWDGFKCYSPLSAEIVCPVIEAIRINRAIEDANDLHSSEVSLDDYDFKRVIFNSGTLEDFKVSVEQMTEDMVKTYFKES
jgi:hypothetical protein